MTYKEIVVETLRTLGGKAYYSEIYNYIETNYKAKLSKSWKAIVRATIERNSSDSDAFEGKENLFYSVEGKGNGCWGLRN